eukprot:2213440-Rhodomonas_salina.3
MLPASSSALCQCPASYGGREDGWSSPGLYRIISCIASMKASSPIFFSGSGLGASYTVSLLVVASQVRKQASELTMTGGRSDAEAVRAEILPFASVTQTAEAVRAEILPFASVTQTHCQ